MNIFEAIKKGLAQPVRRNLPTGWTLEEWKKAGYPMAHYHYPDLIVTDIYGKKHEGIDLFPYQRKYAHQGMGPSISLSEIKKRRFKR